MAEESLHFKIRLPPDLHAKLKDFAAKNHRTMSAEILARVASTIESDEASEEPSSRKVARSKLLRGVEFLDDESGLEPHRPHSAEASDMREFVLQLLREQGLLDNPTAVAKKAPTKPSTKK